MLRLPLTAKFLTRRLCPVRRSRDQEIQNMSSGLAENCARLACERERLTGAPRLLPKAREESDPPFPVSSTSNWD